ncbi:PqqD family peptide modification chaperone [Sediminibacterium ginsengisoli]|uniref:Coenzyme PQQ synthesis protein D (PqqD) n=1 Tax=Sediminibacterium ginsengisoli TaxID=413434 RepID=A0A1T4L6E9_9BACT|nr:PqqD family peptide modification chaperone [Sediminibacterium ginsengisoli]SJZ50167.1 Coenzyme PQQ synthesis protein D (PqqD) [Sediminibacterium ginsengisoli]
MSQYPLTLNSVIRRNEKKFLISRVGTETVMMDLESGDYIGLNEVGTDIWEKIPEPKIIGELVDQLIAEYDVKAEQCILNTLNYLTQMQSIHAIEIVQ